MYEQFPEFLFFDADDDYDLFIDASLNVSGQFSYWCNLHSCVLRSFISWFVLIYYQSYQGLMKVRFIFLLLLKNSLSFKQF